jgi:hypothetical protein
LAGLSTYRFYMVPLWSLELSPLHVGKHESTESCVFPFNEAPIWQPMAAEFVGSLLLGVAPGLVVEHPVMVSPWGRFYDHNFLHKDLRFS